MSCNNQYMTKIILLLAVLFLVFAAGEVRAQERDSLKYIVQMNNGDAFRGNLVAYTDSTVTVLTDFGRVTVPKDQISSFVSLEGPYRNRPHHFLMPTASPTGPGFFLSNYELGFFYGGFGFSNGVTITGGMTLIPGIPVKSQLIHGGAKFTVERNDEFELALGTTFTFLTTQHPYNHIYGVGTFDLGTGRYSAMVLYRVTGKEQARIAVAPFGAVDSTVLNVFYTGSLGAAFGFDAPAFGRDDISWIGEIWNNDLTKVQNTASMLGVRVTNEHLSADFGVALFTAPFIVPVMSFTYRW